MINEKIKEFFRHSMIFGIGGIAGRLIGFLLIPIYTRVFTPADYGILTILQVSSQIITIILNFGTRQAISRIYFDEEDEDYRKTLITSNIYFLIIVSTLIIFLLLFFSNHISFLLFGHDRYQTYVVITLISSYLGVLRIIPQRINRIQLKSVQFVIYQLINLIIGVSLSIYMVVIRKMGIKGALIAGAITTFIVLLLMLPILFRNMNWKFSKPLLIQSLKYGIPFIPHALASFALFGMDRYFLNYYRGTTEVGLYSLAYKFTMIIQLVMGAMQNVWTPFRNNLFDKPDAKEVISRITTYWFMVITLVGLFVSLFAKEVLLIMADQKFWDAYRVVPLLALGYWFYAGYFTYSVTGVDAMKESKWYPRISGVGFFINAIFNFLLIPYYGIYGAAVATVISYCGMTFWGLSISNRLYYVNYEWKRIFNLLFGATVLFILGNYLTLGTSIVYSIVIKSLVIIFCLPILVIYFILNKEEKSVIMRNIKYI